MEGGGHHGAATALMVDSQMSEMWTGGQAAGAREHWLGVRMGEEHTAMHGRALRMPLLQPGSTTVSFCYKLGLGRGGFIVGSYTLPTYYFARQQSCERSRETARSG